MRIHHLNCTTMCPVGRRLVNGDGGYFEAAHICCHCLLIESNDGLVLVDTGLSVAELSGKRLPKTLKMLMQPVLDPAQSALRQIEARGFKADDVRHIVVTHLDFDHAGGLVDFPRAKVHVFADEHDAAVQRRTWLEKNRYLPYQFRHRPDWMMHRVDGERWEGFESVRALGDGGDEILLVPVTGHTRGHCAVAVRENAGWLLHCGDAYFHRHEMDSVPSCPAGIRIYQQFFAIDDRKRVENQQRLRELNQRAGDRIRLFCAHDPVTLEQFQRN